jgi:hypothetical protein
MNVRDAIRLSALFVIISCAGQLRQALALDTLYHSFSEDDGSLWLATDAGAFHVRADGKVEKYDRSTGLNDNVVTRIVRGRDGTLWFFHSGCCVRGDSVVRFERGISHRKTDGSVEVFDAGKRLPSGMIHDIGFDADGSVWFATDRGAAHVTVQGDVELFDKRKGLADVDVRYVFVGQNGEKRFVTSGGIYFLDNKSQIKAIRNPVTGFASACPGGGPGEETVSPLAASQALRGDFRGGVRNGKETEPQSEAGKAEGPLAAGDRRGPGPDSEGGAKARAFYGNPLPELRLLTPIVGKRPSQQQSGSASPPRVPVAVRNQTAEESPGNVPGTSAVKTAAAPPATAPTVGEGTGFSEGAPALPKGSPGKEQVDGFRNTVKLDNRSGRPALVKIVGPVRRTVEIPDSRSEVVRVPRGRYFIGIRYGDDPLHYDYKKGEAFDVEETENSYSEVYITLHPVPGGRYRTSEISAGEFNGM